MDEFYVISVHHTQRRDRYITLWRPDDRGYCWRIIAAGKYNRERVNASLGYYNSGENIAVPVEIVDAMARPGDPRDFDGINHDMPISALRAFDAFLQLVERHHHLDAKAEKLREDAAHTVISRAAKRMDAAWRSKTMAPLCPHCTKAIMPEDVVNGVGMTSKDWEVRRRAAQADNDKKEM
ncbi:hypothetical protein ABZR37_03875 [Achromobacter ruhlandii]|uniref:hypothetical protein n=1 Tax=Achromobacter ruhlandii TaxID=72557 RepID=UPI0035572B2D